MLISLISLIISQCINMSKHQVEHFKYIQLLFVNYASVYLNIKIIKVLSVQYMVD